jgi:hypothetical protein
MARKNRAEYVRAMSIEEEARLKLRARIDDIQQRIYLERYLPSPQREERAAEHRATIEALREKLSEFILG